jgi:hypothetical protein
MNVISISITAVFAVMAASFSVWLLVAITDNLKNAQRYRQTMNKKLSRLRLSRMLSHKGIDQAIYLHTQQVLDIEQHMKRCSKCVNTERCDSVLSASNSEDITDFCNNDSELKAIKRKLEPAA